MLLGEVGRGAQSAARLELIELQPRRRQIAREAAGQAVIAEISAIRDEVNGTPPEDDPPAAS